MAEEEENAMRRAVKKWLGTILQVSCATLGFSAHKS